MDATSKVRAFLETKGQSLQDLPSLQAHHAVLGRYLGSKTKPLNGTTRIYRDVRKTTKRTKHFLTNEITSLKQSITKRARTELKNPQLPAVAFVVDIHKAQDAGKLDALLARGGVVLVRKQVPDGGQEEIVFVEDPDDHFLKADLDSKKRPGKAATVASDCSNSAKKRKQNNCDAVATATTTTTISSSIPPQRLVSPLQSMDYSSSNCDRSHKSGGGDCGAPSVITTTTARTDASSLTDRTFKPLVATSATISATPEPRFQIQSSKGAHSFDYLQEQAHIVCENWIQNEDDGLEVMLRRANLAQSFQAYCGHYKRRLQSNPLADSPIPALRNMNEEQFVTIVNTLGNAMVEWYVKFPSSCLEGEANAWTGITADETDVDAMPEGSIGTYSSLELELPSTLCTDDGVSDIVQCFEEFSMGSSAATPAAAAGLNEWSPVVRDQQHNDDGPVGVPSSNTTGSSSGKHLPPRWSKSRQLFQKRQQGHQFLQKQFRRFRNKKSSSSGGHTSGSNSRGSRKKKKSSSSGGGTAIIKATAAAAVPGTVHVTSKEELSLLYRRLRHNDPALKEAIVDFAIAQQEAKELIRVLGLSFYDWDMRRCSTNRYCTPGSDQEDDNGCGRKVIVLTRSESSDWEDSSK